MPDAESEPRRIRTLGDVQDVLESDCNSVIELLDCVEVCRIENNVDLRHHCAKLALEKALGADNVRVPRVEIAAEEIIRALLARPRGPRSLRPAIPAAANWLADHESRLVQADSGLSFFVADQRDTLNRLVTALDDTSSGAAAWICAVLRKLGRPDIGVSIATRSIRRDRQDRKLRTTRAAANRELGRTSKAKVDIEIALDIDPDDPLTLTTLSRIQMATREHSAALHSASRAVDCCAAREDCNPIPSALMLFSAATLMGDTDAKQRAQNLLRRAEPSDRRNLFVEIHAAEILLECDRPAECKAAIAELRQLPQSRSEEKALERLERRLRLIDTEPE